MPSRPDPRTTGSEPAPAEDAPAGDAPERVLASFADPIGARRAVDQLEAIGFATDDVRLAGAEAGAGAGEPADRTGAGGEDTGTAAVTTVSAEVHTAAEAALARSVLPADARRRADARRPAEHP